jgi:RecA-family ATPase
MGAAEVLALGIEPVNWVWKGILPAGSFVVLSAFPKVGKSTFLYALTMAIARGEPFCGFPTTRCGVLILGVEEAKREAAGRAMSFGLGPDDPIWIHSGPLLNTPETQDALFRFIQDNGIGIVFLDTLSKWWQIQDENDNAAIVRAATPLLDLARATGVCVVAVHHTTKAGGEGGREIRGGGALLGIVDQALIMSKGQGKGERHVKIIGRYEDSPKEMLVCLQDGVYTLLGEGEDAEHEARLARIKGELLKGVPSTIDELVEKVGLKAASIRRACRSLGAEKSGSGKRGDPLRFWLEKDGRVA